MDLTGFRWSDMKKIIYSFLFFPALAFADTPPLSVDDLMTMLANALLIGKSIPGIFGAIFVTFIALAISIALIAKYFIQRNLRETTAFDQDQLERKTLANNLAQMQADATSALIQNMDTVYTQDYQYYVQQITAANYPAIYLKIAPQFYTAVSQFLYDNTLTPTQKAARIIQVVRKNNTNA